MHMDTGCQLSSWRHHLSLPCRAQLLPKCSLGTPEFDWLILSLSLMLRSPVSRSVCLGIKRPSGAYDQIFITVRRLRFCWCGALSDERTGLSFTIAAGPRQSSHCRVRVPGHSWPYFTVSDSRLPISSPPTTPQDHGGGIGPRLHTGFSDWFSI
jgi:hypothetical protein